MSRVQPGNNLQASNLPKLDKEGFLVAFREWNEETAIVLAANEGITLTTEHWEIITCLRDFYETYELAPGMRALVKAVSTALGKDKGNSLHLLTLFPGSPAKYAAKIAGLPKPENCL
jgi:tRNA 2-thiouridine synthesizing protein E